MEAFIGTIAGWGPTWAPRGWAFCHGQLMAISENDALFSLIGTTYGGDGRTTFKLPDLRGRTPIGAGQGAGTSFYPQGASLGQESVTLDVLHMPTHNHVASTANLEAMIAASTSEGTVDTPAPTLVPAKMMTNAGRTDVPTKGYAEGADTTLHPGAVTGDIIIGNTGGNQAFEVVQPVQAIQYIICVAGIFPPRN